METLISLNVNLKNEYFNNFNRYLLQTVVTFCKEVIRAVETDHGYKLTFLIDIKKKTFFSTQKKLLFNRVLVSLSKF